MTWVSGPTARRIAAKFSESCVRDISTQERYGFMLPAEALGTSAHTHLSLRSNYKVALLSPLPLLPMRPALLQRSQPPTVISEPDHLRTVRRHPRQPPGSQDCSGKEQELPGPLPQSEPDGFPRLRLPEHKPSNAIATGGNLRHRLPPEE